MRESGDTLCLPHDIMVKKYNHIYLDCDLCLA